MRIAITLLICLPLAASTLDYTLIKCGSDCPDPFYETPRPAVGALPTVEQLRAYLQRSPDGLYQIKATDWHGGFTVGSFYGPSGWNGSFLYDGSAVICCNVDSLWISGVNDYGKWIGHVISGTSTVGGLGQQDTYVNGAFYKIDDQGVLYGYREIMVPAGQSPVQGSATIGGEMLSTVENPEPGALWMMAGGFALIGLRLVRGARGHGRESNS